MRYRIIKQKINGQWIYYPQYKRFLKWKNFLLDGPFKGWITEISYDDYNKALKFLKSKIKNNIKEVVVEIDDKKIENYN